MIAHYGEKLLAQEKKVCEGWKDFNAPR